MEIVCYAGWLYFYVTSSLIIHFTNPFYEWIFDFEQLKDIFFVCGVKQNKIRGQCSAIQINSNKHAQLQTCEIYTVSF